MGDSLTGLFLPLLREVEAAQCLMQEVEVLS
jgi:hypothetical protein